MPNPARWTTDRTVSGFAAPDTIDAIAARVRHLFARPRLTTVVDQTRQTAIPTPPRVRTGLVLHQNQPLVWWTVAGGISFGVHLTPGDDVMFRIGYEGRDPDEATATDRYRIQEAGTPTDLTAVRIVGGRDADAPSPADRIEIDTWNSHGVPHQTVVVFDHGVDLVALLQLRATLAGNPPPIVPHAEILAVLERSLPTPGSIT